MGADLSAERLVSVVSPLLRNRQSARAWELVRSNWSIEQLLGFFRHPSRDVVLAAVASVGLSGEMHCCEPLTELLHHSDSDVVTAAESALWSIWLTAGTPAATDWLAAALCKVDRCDFEAALESLTGLTQFEPDFSEAHHQRAMVLHTLDHFEEAALEYHQALEGNPRHFAALSGLGHLHTELGDLERAARYYRAALRIHPGLQEIREAVRQIEDGGSRRVVA